MNKAASTISDTCPVDKIRKGEDWLEFDDKKGKYTSVEATLGREYCELPQGEADNAVEVIIEKISNPHNVNVFTYSSIKREVPTKPGWGLYNGATSTETLRWMTEYHLTRAVIVTDSMSTLQKVDQRR